MYLLPHQLACQPYRGIKSWCISSVIAYMQPKVPENINLLLSLKLCSLKYKIISTPPTAYIVKCASFLAIGCRKSIISSFCSSGSLDTPGVMFNIALIVFPLVALEASLAWCEKQNIIIIHIKINIKNIVFLLFNFIYFLWVFVSRYYLLHCISHILPRIVFIIFQST